MIQFHDKYMPDANPYNPWCLNFAAVAKRLGLRLPSQLYILGLCSGLELAWTPLMWCPYSLPKRCILRPYELSMNCIFWGADFLLDGVCNKTHKMPFFRSTSRQSDTWSQVLSVADNLRNTLVFVCLAGGSRWKSYKTCDNDHNKHILYLSWCFSSLDFWIINRNTCFFVSVSDLSPSFDPIFRWEQRGCGAGRFGAGVGVFHWERCCKMKVSLRSTGQDSNG